VPSRIFAALKKELSKARAMTGILAERAEEKRRLGEALIEANKRSACRVLASAAPADNTH
jgi:hypothetical protein